MTLLRPWALVLLLGLIPLLVLMRARTTPGRLRRAARRLRLLALVLVAIASAGPARPVAPPAAARQVAAVLDVSSSVVAEAATAALASERAAAPGRVAELEAPGSDLASGLRTAVSALRDAERPAEVVVISDGRAVGGSLWAEAERLEGRGVSVREVRVPSRTVHLVELRPSRSWVRSGEPLRLEVAVGGSGRLTVVRRGPEGERRWERAAQPGRIELEDRPRGRGRAVYTASLNGETLRAVVPVRRAARARILADPPASGAFLARVLREGGFEVEVRAPADGLGTQDLVALVDVPARGPRGLSEAHQRALMAWTEAGGGLLVVGGGRAFGPGGYRGAPLEEALPVRSEPSTGEQPALALLLVVDRSSSMAGPKLELAKLAAGEALAQLAPRDHAGAIVFNQRAWWAIPLRRGVEARARARLETHAAGGGTDLEPALDLAAPALRAARAKVKHLVVLTDGMVPKADAVEKRIAGLRGEGITVSTVALGGDADHVLLRRLAEAGGGRHHAVPVAADLPRILVRETRRVARKAGRTPAFRARVRAPGAVLRGVDPATGPRLLGLADTRARATATTWLSGHADRPLLAGWDLGSGRVITWTSDDGVRWARAWRSWSGFPQLLRQAARWSTPARLTLPERAERVALRWEGRGVQVRGRRPQGLRLVLRGVSSREAPVRAWAVGRGEAAFAGLQGAFTVEVRRRDALVGLSGVWLPAPGAERRAPVAPVWPGGEGATLRPKRLRSLELWFLLGALATLVVEVACRRASR